MALIQKSGNKLVRCATMADYEHVMNINDNVNEGTDYLPELYHQYFNDAKSVPYVLEIDGDVVCILLQHYFYYLLEECIKFTTVCWFFCVCF